MTGETTLSNRSFSSKWWCASHWYLQQHTCLYLGYCRICSCHLQRITSCWSVSDAAASSNSISRWLNHSISPITAFFWQNFPRPSHKSTPVVTSIITHLFLNYYLHIIIWYVSSTRLCEFHEARILMHTLLIFVVPHCFIYSGVHCWLEIFDPYSLIDPLW